MSLGPVSCKRTEAPYLLGYSEPLYFSGPTPAQLRLRFGTPTGPKYCVTSGVIYWSQCVEGLIVMGVVCVLRLILRDQPVVGSLGLICPVAA